MKRWDEEARYRLCEEGGDINLKEEYWRKWEVYLREWKEETKREKENELEMEGNGTLEGCIG